MILCDFLLRQKHGNGDPHDIIPISFSMHNMLHEKILQLRKDGQIFSTNVITDNMKWNKLPKVHDVKTILDINTLPEKPKDSPSS